MAVRRAGKEKARMNTVGEERKILSDCMEKNSVALASCVEKRIARIYELAHVLCRKILSETGGDIMTAVCAFDEAREIYSEGKAALCRTVPMGKENADERRVVSDAVSLCDTFCLCRAISRFGGEKYTDADVLGWLSDGDVIQSGRIGETKVAFVRGRQANEAFSRFARCIPGGVMPFGEESFADVCRSVYSGVTEYGIVPVENSSDGRLTGLYGLFERYGLYIIMLCEVGSGDGEGYTKFALCSRSMKLLRAGGERILHIRLTLDTAGGLSDLLFCGKYFGASLRRAYPVPTAATGRENSFDVSFCVDGADIPALICALKLEYPQFSAVGIYTEIKAEGI